MDREKFDWKKLAPYSLIVSAIGLIIWIVFLFLNRDFSNIWVQVGLGLFVLGLAGFIFLDPARIRKMLSGRQARYGSNALLVSLAFIGIVIVVNYIAFQNPVDWDLTADKENTLLPETVEIIEKLPENVQILAFFQSNQSTQSAQELLDRYKAQSDGKIDYQFIDPVADPVAAIAANVSTGSSGAIVLVMGDKQEKVTFASEDQITNALVRLMADKPVVYFLSGHGEASLEGTGELGYTEVKTALDAKGYIVNDLNLLSTPSIPDDAQAIVIAGPHSALSQEEVDQIAAFVQQGGSLFVLAEPTLVTRMVNQDDPLINYLRDSWGITVGDDIVIDINFQNPYQTVAYEYTMNPIIDPIVDQNLSMAFVYARSVSITSEIPNVTTVEMFRSTPGSWAETDLVSLETQQAPSFDPTIDIEGPVPLAVSADNSATGSRLVVIGDVHFAIDDNFTYLGNGDLFVNSVDWVTEQEDLMSLSAREQTTRLIVTPSRLNALLLILASLCAVPLLIIIAAVSMFIYRRRLG